jgi:putative virulence related protein PagC
LIIATATQGKQIKSGCSLKFLGGIIVKKIILPTLVSLAFASTALAATPPIDLGAGQAQIGYSFSNLETSMNGIGDLGTYHGNGYQFAYGLNSKLAITGDQLATNSKNFNVYNNGVYQGTFNGLKFDATTIGLQYKVSDNIAVSTGSVKSSVKSDSGSNSSSEVYGGIAYKQNFSKNMNGYASYLKSSNVQDWKAGVAYNVGKNTSVDVGYRDYQSDGTGVSAKGMSYGVSHKF